MPKHNSCKGKSFVSVVSYDIKVCRLCGFKTEHATALRLHKKVVHKKTEKLGLGTDYQCARCSQTFETGKELSKHLRTHKVSKA